MPTTFEEAMAFHPDNPYVYEEIRDSFDQLLPFVGAGLTADVYGTWGKALEGLGGKLTDPDTLLELDSLLNAGKYFDAAQLLEESRGARNFARDLVHYFSPTKLGTNKKAVQEGAVWLLPDLFACPVLTTNFDQAIERVYRERGNSSFEALDPFSRDLRSETARLMRKPCVFKLHGTVMDGMTDYSRIVFTKAQYDEHYGSKGDTREALRDFVDRRPLLFLGCSLIDDITVDVLTEAAGPGIMHYAIVSCGRDERDRRIRKAADAGIRAIVYEDGKYDSTRVVLERLRKELRLDRRNLLREVFSSEHETNGHDGTHTKALDRRGARAHVPDFRIGFTFTDGYRDSVVRPICEALLSMGYAEDELFFDEWHKPLIAGVGSDSRVQEVLHDHCNVIVVLLSPDYASNDWSGHVAWRAVRNLINTGGAGKICPLRIGDVSVDSIDGLFAKSDVTIDVDNKTSRQIAQDIVEWIQYHA